MEQWRDILDFPGYQVSDHGNVRSRINNKYGVGNDYHILTPYVDERGYKSVQLGRGNRRSVHRLVASAFIPNPNALPLVRHRDDNPSNNHVENLAWGTQTDNMQDCVKHGRLVGNIWPAIESTKQAVIATPKDGGESVWFPSMSEASRQLGVWPQHISSVIKGKISQTGGWIFRYAEDVAMTKSINAFPGYEFVNGHNMYRGVDLGKGGYIVGNPGMYRNVAMLDIRSLHPSSIVAMNCFGEYTKHFKDLLDARIAIKEGDFETARKMLNGRLAPYLDDESTAKDLAQALKIAINSVYGLTAANFDNPFRDIRNKNNIVALRGALFMKTLQDEVEAQGYTIVGIRTDSIKIAEATPEIIQFCMDFANKYSYVFEYECNYDRICLVNKSAYIAKYSDDESINGKYAGKWTATAAQFQVPYVFKTLFSHEPIVFDDLCETKEVKVGALYLDMNEHMTVTTGAEKELAWRNKEVLGNSDYIGYRDPAYKNVSDDELRNIIAKGHNYVFVGRVGQFCPIKPGFGGGELVVNRDGKYSSASGAKGYRWLESETVRQLHNEDTIDKSYYQKLVDDAVETISQYGDFEAFVAD